MEKVKINPLVLGSLSISALSMALYAFEQFNEHKVAYGVMFTVLAVLFTSLVVASVIRNKTLTNEIDKEKEPK